MMRLDDAMLYWQSGAGMDNLVPPGEREPEGPGFGRFISGQCGKDRVLDFGCGTGRLAAFFDAKHYVGVDICAQVIEAARDIMPSHRFKYIWPDDVLPSSDVILAHTVLLHVSDQMIDATVARFRAPRVIISEILGQEWRRVGDPPVFNREKSDYMV
jgi:SAM-dependent methyltransferase